MGRDVETKRYIIRYYNRFPADPKARWDILRAEVYAADPTAAAFLFWHEGIEIIDTFPDPTYTQPIMKTMEDA